MTRRPDSARRQARFAAAATAAAVLCSGCLENAVLEVELTLPRHPEPSGPACGAEGEPECPGGSACVQAADRLPGEGRCAEREGCLDPAERTLSDGSDGTVCLDTYAFIQVRRAEAPLEEIWASESFDFPGTLLGDSPQPERRSVVTDDDGIAVHLKVRFCTGTEPGTDQCSGEDELVGGRALWFVLERPFYLGERTRWVTSIAEVPGDRPEAAVVVDKCEIEGCVEADPGTTDFCRITDGRHYCE